MVTFITTKKLIRKLRSAKTAEEERTIIADECANIRASLQDPRANMYLARITIKLIFISMLGYPVQWSYMEVVKLCAAAKTHKEKRVAYLALSLLLHSKNEYVMMATATVRADIESGNQYHASLALAALAAVSNEEMMREMVPSLAKLMEAKSQPYLKKKALLAAARAAICDPDVAETFIAPCATCMGDKSHATVLAAAELAEVLCEVIPETAKPAFANQVSLICKLLNALNNAPGTGDHVIGGVSDPFLQCALLRVLALVAPFAAEKRGMIEDIMGKLAQGRPSRRGEKIGPKVAVQFEAARAIIQSNSSPELRAKATSGLTEALASNDNTLKYSSLATLCSLARYSDDRTGLQRHRRTIVACLRQPSLTLKKRALTLLVLLADRPSAKALVKELLQFVEEADKDLRVEVVTAIAFIADNFATSAKWHFKVLLDLLKVDLHGTGSVGADLDEKVDHTDSTIMDVMSQCIGLVQRTQSIQGFAAQTLYLSLLVESENGGSSFVPEPLVIVALFIIGEFAELLAGSGLDIRPTQVVELISNRMRISSSLDLQRYGLACLAKIGVKMNGAHDAALACVNTWTTSFEPEIQQRAVEYSSILRLPNSSGLLDRIQPPKAKRVELSGMSSSDSEKPMNEEAAGEVQLEPAAGAEPTAPTQQPQPNLLAAPANSIENLLAQGSTTSAGTEGIINLLIDTNVSSTSPAAKPASGSVSPSSGNAAADILGLLGSSLPVSTPSPTAGSSVPREIFRNSVIAVALEPRVVANGAEFRVRVTATANTPINLVFRAPNGSPIQSSEPSAKGTGPTFPPVFRIGRIAGPGPWPASVEVWWKEGAQAKQHVINIPNVLQ